MGEPFPVHSRGGRIPRYEPIIVWTSLIGQAFLDGYEILGEKRYLEVAKSVCRWICALPREKTKQGTCLSYVAYEQSSIHNSNMLGAAMLARTARITGEPDIRNLAAGGDGIQLHAPVAVTAPGITARTRNTTGSTISTPDTTWTA